MLSKNEKIKIFVIFLIIYYCINNNIIIFNSNIENINEIITIIEKYLNPESIPILNKNEKLIAQYWNKLPILCPFSKLTSHGLTREEALLIIDFFQIETIQDLEKLKDFLKNIPK